MVFKLQMITNTKEKRQGCCERNKGSLGFLAILRPIGIVLSGSNLFNWGLLSHTRIFLWIWYPEKFSNSTNSSNKGFLPFFIVVTEIMEASFVVTEALFRITQKNLEKQLYIKLYSQNKRINPTKIRVSIV